MVDVRSPACTFLGEALGYVEKCFAVEEWVAQQRNGGPYLGVSKEVMANASALHGEKGFEGEAE